MPKRIKSSCAFFTILSSVVILIKVGGETMETFYETSVSMKKNIYFVIAIGDFTFRKIIFWGEELYGFIKVW